MRLHQLLTQLGDENPPTGGALYPYWLLCALVWVFERGNPQILPRAWDVLSSEQEWGVLNVPAKRGLVWCLLVVLEPLTNSGLPMVARLVVVPFSQRPQPMDSPFSPLYSRPLCFSLTRD